MKSILQKKSTQTAVLIALVTVTLVALLLYLITSQIVWSVTAIAALVLLIAFSTVVGIRAMHLLLSIHRRTSSMEMALGNQSKLVSDSDRRLKLIFPVIHNTAGSVGKMSPLVRAIAFGAATKDAKNDKAGAIAQTSAAKKQEVDKNSKDSVTFPPIAPKGSKAPTFPVNAMVIADDFTASAFSYEWNQFTPSKTDWRDILETESIDLLFVESAWEGNGGAWKYQLVGSLAPRDEIVELVQECKSRNIPTVFWNKEDPPHFEDFLKSAALFDYVFTTDVNKVPDYISRLGHDRVDVLPFAAQPKIHNPARIRGVDRSRDVVFGGMYFRHKYPERRQQLDYLLPAAGKFNLDIFSRQLGGDENYQFPAPFDKMVRGTLPYPSMLTAYHAYKVVLNVNSVVDSKSMCARRIFEATACGAAVVSAESPAILEFYPDNLVTVAHDESDAYQKLRILLRSNDYRDRKVHLAQRLTWANYTYEERVKKILSVLGIGTGGHTEPKIAVITPTVRPENFETIFQNFSQQSYPDKELLICCHGFQADQAGIQSIADRYNVDSYRVIEKSREYSLADNLNAMIEMADGEVIARMDDDDWYGPNYLLDLHNSLKFSQADVVGKAASYIYFEESNMSVLTMPQMEHKYSDFVRGATIMARKDTLLKTPFPNGERGEDSDFLTQILSVGGTIYSADRFNFSVSRLHSKESHTWGAADNLLFGTGEMKYIGRALDQIEI